MDAWWLSIYTVDIISSLPKRVKSLAYYKIEMSLNNLTSFYLVDRALLGI